ncbi:hypothetical protein QA640_24350 [Bradyrhizobium sp. CB82]|uniref:hypothetical protein n=1 Tax=Bradyrhizobium sp. CB82 TaxID=3039159 RepID=UPI0024B11B93|nr:hypothetical protein [Bradyrhizobium sp. CB82]WFU37602.1 hypothetical protein QA640_24350 [Bradyrhizobium sp. CB82]
MRRPSRRQNNTLPDGRPVKITLGEMRATGVRDLLVFCQDYKCSHNIKLRPPRATLAVFTPIQPISNSPSPSAIHAA